MKRRIQASAIAVALAALSYDDVRAHAADTEKPFAVDHTMILPSGGTYFVEGRVRIARGVSITVQKDTKIVGRGDAVVELEGQLEIHGVSDLHVTLQDVTIEVQPKFDSLLLDIVDVVGKSAGVVSPKGKPVDGRIFIQNTEFKDRSTVDVTMSANNVDLQRVRAANPIRVKAVDPEGASANKVRLMVMNCCNAFKAPVSGFLSGGLLVDHVADVTVRCNRLGGEKVAFADCGAVTFDANLVGCKTLEFTQSAAGRFGKTTVSKCDFQCEKIVAFAPYVEGKAETFTMERCWFDGETGSGTIRDRFVKDRSRDPKCGVLVDFKKIEDKPLGLAGAAKK